MSIKETVSKIFEKFNPVEKGGPGSGRRPGGGTSQEDYKAALSSVERLRATHTLWRNEAQDKAKMFERRSKETSNASSKTYYAQEATKYKDKASESQKRIDDLDKRTEYLKSKIKKGSTPDPFEKGGPGSGRRPEGGGKGAEESSNPLYQKLGKDLDAKIKEVSADAKDPKAGEYASGAVSGYNDAKKIIDGSDNLKDAYQQLDQAISDHEKFGKEVKDAGGTLTDNYAGKGAALKEAHSMTKEAIVTAVAAATAGSKEYGRGPDYRGNKGSRPRGGKMEKTNKRFDPKSLDVIKGCTPAPNESEDKFIGRCIGEMVDSGRDEDQAAAICYSKWSGKMDKANSRAVIMSPEPDEDESDFMDRCVAYHTGRGDPEANAERVCGTMWDNKADAGIGVNVETESSLSSGFMVRRP